MSNGPHEAHRRLEIAFTGDLLLSPEQHDENAAAERLFHGDVLRELARSDYRVVNLEGPLTGKSRPSARRVWLRSSPQAASVLEGIKCDVLHLANNHIFDQGVEGFRDTLDIARRRGWRWLGAGENLKEAAAPVVLEGGGLRVGLCGVCHNEGLVAAPGQAGVFGQCWGRIIQKTLEQLRSECDWVVLIYHGGEEFTYVPSPERRRRLRRYLRWGADVVVAHHAHTVQRWETTGGKYIFYGLGNLLMDTPYQRARAGTEYSVILRLQFTSQTVSFDPLFTRWDRQRARVVRHADHPEFRPLLPDHYEAEWHADAYRVVCPLWEGAGDRNPGRLARAESAARYAARFLLSLRMLGQRNQRPVMIGALKHLLFGPGTVCTAAGN